MSDDDILIREDGSVTFVYSDLLAEVFDGETLQTRRVSEVEPASTSGAFGNEWVADMKLAGAPGVVLGPFPTRQQALDAERQWLRTERGL